MEGEEVRKESPLEMRRQARLFRGRDRTVGGRVEKEGRKHHPSKGLAPAEPPKSQEGGGNGNPFPKGGKSPEHLLWHSCL